MRKAREEYLAKLRDPRWQKRRLEILSRDGFRCRFCCATDRTLHVHHTYYQAGSEPWDYPLKALITLCENCHEAEKFENRREDEERLIRALRRTASRRELNELASAFCATEGGLPDLTIDALAGAVDDPGLNQLLVEAYIDLLGRWALELEQRDHAADGDGSGLH